MQNEDKDRNQIKKIERMKRMKRAKNEASTESLFEHQQKVSNNEDFYEVF